MRRRQITVGAVVGLTAGCLVAGALAAGSPRPYPTSAHPPQPTLITLGVTRSATLVSWCWSHRTKTGGTVGVCADGSPARPPHQLGWRPHVPVRLDLHLPAHHVALSTF